jgi:hypothetical protein
MFNFNNPPNKTLILNPSTGQVVPETADEKGGK